MLLIAATFFTLEEIASYGITNQVAAIIWSIGLIYWGTYAPKIYQKQVQADNDFTKRTIIYACAIALLTFAVLGGGAMLLGNWALTLIGSKTLLLPQKYILAMLILMCYNVFVGICAGFEVARNRIPFLYGTFITAALTLGIFFTAVKWLDMGMFSIIIAPIGGLAHLWWMRATIGSLGFARGDLRSAARIFWDFTKQKLLRRQ